MGYNNGSSSKNGTKKIVISLCVVLLAVIAIVVATVVTTSKNKEESLETNALQNVPDGDKANVSNNDKKDQDKTTDNNNENKEKAQENNTTTTENNDTENTNTNLVENEVNTNNNQVQNNNVVNNNNNNNDNNNQANTEFIQKEIIDEKVEKEYKENNSTWNEENVKLENLPSVSDIEKADKELPKITVKGDEEPAQKYIGDKDRNIFSKVSFKLYDNYGVSAYKINDGDYTKLTVNNWSDANFDNIKDRLVYGKNTITLKDVAENETTYEFTYDNKVPEITVKPESIGDKDRNIFSKVSFKLHDEYGVAAYKVNDGEYKNVTVNNWSDANFNNISKKLNYGKNTITLKDVAGNETTFEFTYDNIAPEITVKPESIGDKDRNIFSKASFKLHDEYGVAAYKINDGEYKNVTVKNWSDANFNNISKKLNYGKNTITLKDVAGNETTFEFVYDNKAPEITVKPESIGDKDRNIFSKVSFKLHDEYGVAAYKINDGEYKNVTVKNWSDANFNNISKKLNYGKNTITLKDVAGNETTFEFTYDNIAPSIKTLGILNLDHFKEGDPTYANKDDTIRVYASFDEELANLPTVKIAGNEYTFRLDRKEDNGTYVYMMDKKLADIAGLEDGKIEFEISGYKDIAGNVGETLTQDNTNYKGYESVTYDTKSATVFSSDFYANSVNPIDKIFYINNGKTIVINAKFNEMLAKNPNFILKSSDGTEYTLDGTYTGIDNKGDGQGDRYTYVAKFDTTDKEIAQGELTYTISEIYDKAGNKTDDITKPTNGRRVIYDSIAPSISIDKTVNIEFGTEFVDDIREKISDNITETKDLKVEIYPVNGIEVDTTKLGTYKINYKITDRAGNFAVETRVVNVVDTTAPEIVFPENVIGLNKNELYLEAGTEFTLDGLVNVKDNADPNPKLKITGITYLGGPNKEDNIYGKTEEFIKNGLDTKLTGLNNRGRYNIDYEATDASGNKSTRTLLVMFKDNISPTLTIDEANSIGKDGYYSKVVVNATDNAYLAYYEINGMKSTIDNNIIGISAHGRTFLNNTINGHIKFDEENTLVVYDKAGNKSNVITFVADRTAPVITGIENGKTYTNEVIFNVIENNLDKVVIDGNEYTENIPEKVTGVGNHTIIAYDKAGNSSQVSFEIKKIKKTLTKNDMPDVKFESKEFTYDGKSHSLVVENLPDFVTVSYINNERTEVGTNATVTAVLTAKEDSDYVGKVMLGATLTIKRPDTKPVITVNNKNVTIEAGTKYDVKSGVSAYDDYDKDLTNKIDISGDVNNKKVGTYTITYNVKNSAGVDADSVTKTVIVKDTTKPIITLNGDNEIHLKVGAKYTEQGATAIDNSDDTLEVKINRITYYGLLGSSFDVDDIMKSTLKTNIFGSRYVIDYYVKDSSGNIANATRTVYIDKTALDK